MPTVLRLDGYRFYFYSHEPNEPPHVHVDKGGATLKAWLDPVTLARTGGFRPRDQWHNGDGHRASHDADGGVARSEEHTSELQSLMRISNAVFCLKKKKSNQEKAQTKPLDKHHQIVTTIVRTRADIQLKR